MQRRVIRNSTNFSRPLFTWSKFLIILVRVEWTKLCQIWTERSRPGAIKEFA